VRNIVATTCKLTAELDLKRMAGEVVN